MLSATEGPEPAMTDSELEEYATVRLSECNALRKMPNYLGDTFEEVKMERTLGTTAQQSGGSELSGEERTCSAFTRGT